MKEAMQNVMMPIIHISSRSIPDYPRFAPVTLEMREEIHGIFSELADGVSEYTFANLFLFADRYHYEVSMTQNKYLIISGTQPEKQGKRFFMTPCGMPEQSVLRELFSFHDYWKGIPESVAVSSREQLEQWGIQLNEDRGNYDYLYYRADLAGLPGKKYHKKRNLVNAFQSAYHSEAEPLTPGKVPDAISVLEQWRLDKGSDGDYQAARAALNQMDQLGMSGKIFYVEEKPVGWCMGESLAQGRVFAVHFEKGIDSYKGIYQFMNQNFAASLPESVVHINREQDLGDAGLRQAKMSYRPSGFVLKYTGRLSH